MEEPEAMGGAVFRLVYCSRNATKDVSAEPDKEIADILEVSRRNNPLVGVTGALFYSDGCFAQVLEGPQDAVGDVFERIQCDARHRDIVVLDNGPQSGRLFEQWSMAHVARPDRAEAEDPRLADAFAPGSSLDGERVAAYLRNLLLREQEWMAA